MQENLRNVGSLGTEIPIDRERTLVESVRIMGRTLEGAIVEGESRIGLAIQTMVQDYLRSIDVSSAVLPVRRVTVGDNVVLDFDELELYRSSRIMVGHNVGNPPLGPDAWLRNHRGIIDQITRISGR